MELNKTKLSVSDFSQFLFFLPNYFPSALSKIYHKLAEIAKTVLAIQKIIV